MTSLLVLRPQPGAAATVALADALGHHAVVAPLFEVRPVAWTAPPADAYGALMLTSANTVRHAGAGLAAYRALPVYAVGPVTAGAARDAGFDVRHVGAGDATGIVAALAANGIGRTLHLCGAKHREGAHGAVAIDRMIVYRADPVGELPSAAGDALAAGAVSLIHSPRAGTVFSNLVEKAGLKRVGLAIAAISARAAAAAGPGWRAVAVADVPTDRALLAVAAALCEGRVAMRRGEGA